jgi:phosphotransferase system  glucose/maltose/N-acetylglucosamine-specific IIC component
LARDPERISRSFCREETSVIVHLVVLVCHAGGSQSVIIEGVDGGCNPINGAGKGTCPTIGVMQPNSIPRAQNPSPLRSPHDLREKQTSSQGAWGTCSFSLGLFSALISGLATMGACFGEFGFAGGYEGAVFLFLGIYPAAILGIVGIACAIISNKRHEPGKRAGYGLLLSLAFVPIIMGIMCLAGLFQHLGWMD